MSGICSAHQHNEPGCLNCQVILPTPTAGDSNDYTKYPKHPLYNVSPHIIAQAREAMRTMADELVDSEMVEPIADAILIAIAPYITKAKG